MANRLIDVDVKMGRIIPVVNQKRNGNAKKEYYCIKTENERGGDEQYRLFTQRELETSPIIDAIDLPKYNFKPGTFSSTNNGRVILEGMKSGRIYPSFKVNCCGIKTLALLIRTEEYDQTMRKWFYVIRRISNTKLKAASYRSSRNPEDLVKTTWFQDLLD